MPKVNHAMSQVRRMVYAECRHCGRENEVGRAPAGTSEFSSTAEREFTCGYCGYQFCVPEYTLQIRYEAGLECNDDDLPAPPLSD